MVNTCANVECSLCQTPLGRFAVSSEGQNFCCSGCEAVYRILKVRGELSDPTTSSLYQEALERGLLRGKEEEVDKKEQKTGERFKLFLEVDGMFCPSCALVLERLLLKRRGIFSCTVDYSTDLAVVEYNPRELGSEEVLRLVKRVGYEAHPIDEGEKRVKSRQLISQLGIAFFCMMNIMTLSTFIYSDPHGKSLFYAWLSAAFAAPVALYSSWPFYKRFWGQLQARVFGMESLLTLSVLASFGFSVLSLLRGSYDVYFDSMSMVVSFVLFGKYLEQRAKKHAQLAFLSLHRTLPKKARVLLDDGRLEQRNRKDLKAQDRVFATYGETIISDGHVIEGSAHIDESLVTGESSPKHKQAGDCLLAGTRIQAGSLTYQLSQAPEHSSLKKLLESIEGILQKRHKQQLLLDRITQVFIPFVVALAMTVGGILAWQGASSQEVFLRILTILLIACPCTIGIARPLVEAFARSKLSDDGLIVKHAAVFAVDCQKAHWVFDKTGTLTLGELSVLRGLEKLPADLCSILSALTSRSLHPVSRALYQKVSSAPAVDLEEYKEVLGKGVQATYHRKAYCLGSYQWMQELGVQGIAKEQGLARCYFACEGHLLTSIELGDDIRPESRSVIHALSLKQCHLLSGDQELAVQKVAKVTGIMDYRSTVSPQGKQQAIQQLKKKGAVIFVGDGLNDAPALAEASIGVATFGASELACQVAQVVLTKNTLSPLKSLPNIICKTQLLYKQNLTWSFSYNGVGVILAVTGMLTPLYAALMMVSSSLVVIANSLRMKGKSLSQID